MLMKELKRKKIIVIVLVVTLICSSGVTSVFAATNEGDKTINTNVSSLAGESIIQEGEAEHNKDGITKSNENLMPRIGGASADVAIDESNFPDAAFREYVKQYDKDGDGALSIAELAAVTNMEPSFKNITSLQGIEFFTSLIYLNCSMNKLTSLDLSKNIALVNLYCYNNQLTSLDLTNNTALTHLMCNDNKITSLDLNSNNALISVNCSNNQLTTLSVNNKTSLTFLNCRKNQLTSLDVSGNTALTTFNGTIQTIHLLPWWPEYNINVRDPYIDGTKIKDVSGATCIGTTMKDYTAGGTVTYKYDCGNGNVLDVSLIFDLPSTTRSITYKDAMNHFDSWKADYTAPNSYNEGIGVLLPTADNIEEKEGHTFAGWYDNENFTGNPITEIEPAATGDKILYAKWEANQYTVTFKDWNGNVLKTEQVTYGTAATAPADPTREGHTFVGWDVTFDNVTSDMEVTAQYREEPAVNPTTEYVILEGANSIWVKGEINGIRIKSNGDIAKFTGIKVDGVEVTEENYVAEAGSTVVTMNASYLETLEQGKHTFTMLYIDGEVSTEFTITSQAIGTVDFTHNNMNLETAQTGDNHIVEPLLVTGGISSIAAAIAFFFRKKNKSE